MKENKSTFTIFYNQGINIFQKGENMKKIQLPSTKLYHYQSTQLSQLCILKNTDVHSSPNKYELFIIVKGNFYLQDDEEEYSLKKGEYLILPSTESKRKIIDKNASVYYLLFSIDSYDSSISQSGTLTIDFEEKNNFTIQQTGIIPKPEKIIVLLKQLQNAVSSISPLLILDCMTTSIIIELCNQIQIRHTINNPYIIDKKLHSDIIDYIEQNIHNNIKITDIALHFGYNEKYLSHLFAEATGIKLKNYITNRKIEYANFLLADTNKCISDIAAELGYIDSHNFSRMYKNFTGLTPSEYRNTYAANISACI